jgi:periplasmic protein TonB
MRRAGVWLRWGGSFCLVLAAHVAAFWVWHRPSRAIGTPAPSVIMMELAPAPQPAAPPPAPKPPPPPAQELPLPPVAPPPLPAVPKPVVALPPRHVVPQHPRTLHPPAVRRAPPMPVVRPAPAVIAHPPAPPVPAPAAAQLAGAPPPGQTIAAWQEALLAHLALYKRFPSQAQELGEQGVVLMRVTLDHAGNVLAMQMVQSSGYPELDAEAPAWIRRASPMPAFPPEITASQVNLVIPLRFTLQ